MPKRTVLIGCFSTVSLSLIPHLIHSRRAIFQRLRLYSISGCASSIIPRLLSPGSTHKSRSAGATSCLTQHAQMAFLWDPLVKQGVQGAKPPAGVRGVPVLSLPSQWAAGPLEVLCEDLSPYP